MCTGDGIIVSQISEEFDFFRFSRTGVPKAVREAHYINWFAAANHILPGGPDHPDHPDCPDSKVSENDLT